MSLSFFTLINSFLNKKAGFIIGVLLKLKIRQEKWGIFSLIGQITKKIKWRRTKQIWAIIIYKICLVIINSNGDYENRDNGSLTPSNIFARARFF